MAATAEKRIPIGVRLLPSALKALDDAGERMGGKSRAFVVEVLTRLYAGQLDANTRVPVGAMPTGSRAKRGTGRAKKSPPDVVHPYTTPQTGERTGHLPKPAKKPRRKG